MNKELVMLRICRHAGHAKPCKTPVTTCKARMCMEVHGGHLLQPHFAKKIGSKHQNQNSSCQIFDALHILFVFWQFGKILQEVNTA